MYSVSLTKHTGGSRKLREKRERTTEGFMKRGEKGEEFSGHKKTKKKTFIKVKWMKHYIYRCQTITSELHERDMMTALGFS